MEKTQKGIIVLLHIALLIACICIVMILNKLGENNQPQIQNEQIQVSEESKEDDETLKFEESTVSDSSEQENGDKVSESTEEVIQETAAQITSPPILSESIEDAPYIPPTLMLASDLHYISSSTYNNGIAFEYMLENDDGKISQYSDEIVDTLLDEAIQIKPSALLLTGDITLNGELENHLELAKKLRRVKDAGVQVLVIPGNHDINNQNAATYFDSERKETEYLKSGEEFYKIYREFGFDQALCRDEYSLSYLYELDEKHWLLLLDSCQYEDYNHVNGRIRPETLFWIESQLKLAKETGIQVTVAAHHNLLSESRLYTTECTLENHQDVIELLEQYEVPLYISGHLHAQRIKKHFSEPGADPNAYSISEIVLSPYALPPCQYGLLKWNEEDYMTFQIQKAPSDNLSEDCSEFLKSTIRDQVKKNIFGVPDDLKEEMASLYAEVYYDYCAGNQISWDEINNTRAYRLWERVVPDGRYMMEMLQMAKDGRDGMQEWSSGFTQQTMP